MHSSITSRLISANEVVLCALTIFCSSRLPLEYVVAMVEAQCSAYHGDWQSCEAELMESVYMLPV